VGIFGDSFENIDKIIRKGTAFSPFFGDFLDIIFSGQFAGKKEIEYPFGKRFFTARSLRQFFSKLRDVEAAKADTFNGIES
jgi:hypothetical protein